MKLLEQREDKDRWTGQYSNEENLITYIGGGDQIKINSTALSAKIRYLEDLLKTGGGT